MTPSQMASIIKAGFLNPSTVPVDAFSNTTWTETESLLHETIVPCSLYNREGWCEAICKRALEVAPSSVWDISSQQFSHLVARTCLLMFQQSQIPQDAQHMYLAMSGGLSTPESLDGSCLPGYSGNTLSTGCTAAGANQVVVGPTDKQWTNQTTNIAVRCPWLMSETDPVLLEGTLCPSASRGAQQPVSGCTRIPTYAHLCRRCNLPGWAIYINSMHRCVLVPHNFQPYANGTGFQQCQPHQYSELGPRFSQIYQNTDFLFTANSPCLDCPENNVGGTSLSTLGMCVPCGIGHYRFSQDTECKECPSGFTTSGNGSPCIQCPTGFKLNSDGVCEQCLSTSIQNGLECIFCESASVKSRYINVQQQTVNTVVSPGTVVETYVNATHSLVNLACATTPQEGWGKSGVMNQLVQCVPGTHWRNSSVNSRCELCALGTFNNAHGQSQCSSLCAAGTSAESLADLYNAIAALPLESMSGESNTIETSSFAFNATSKINTVNQIISQQNIQPPPWNSLATPKSPASFFTAYITVFPSVCTPCARGFYSHEGYSHCVACDTRRNQYSTTIGSSGCETCVSGLLSNGTHCLGTVQARNVTTTKTVVFNNNITCVGPYFQETPQTCKLCPSGQQPRVDRLGCANCSAGSFSRESTLCLPCTSGMYQDVEGQSTCKMCNVTAGEYSSGIASVNCTRCDVGSVSKGSFCAPCLENQVSVSGKCVGCTPPLYKIGHSCQPCNGTMMPVLGRCMACSELLLRNSQCKRCQKGTVSEGGKCVKNFYSDKHQGQTATNIALRMLGVSHDGMEFQDLRIVLPAIVTTLALMLMASITKTRPKRVTFVSLLCFAKLALAELPDPFLSSMDNIDYLSALGHYAQLYQLKPQLDRSLIWEQRLFNESNAVPTPVFSINRAAYGSLVGWTTQEQNAMVYSISVLDHLSTTTYGRNNFVIEVCASVTRMFKRDPLVSTTIVPDAFWRAFNLCILQGITEKLASELQTVQFCDIFGPISQHRCLALVQPYRYSTPDTEIESCQYGYITSKAVTTQGVLVPKLCSPAYPGQLVSPYRQWNAISQSVSSVDHLTPLQYTTWCPAGMTTKPEQATICSSGIEYNTGLQHLFVCDQGCCGTTTFAYECALNSGWVNKYTGKSHILPELLYQPIALPHFLLSKASYFERVFLAASMDTPVSITVSNGGLSCPTNTAIFDKEKRICLPCPPNYEVVGTNSYCSKCQANKYRLTELYSPASTFSCVLARPEVQLYAYQSDVLSRDIVSILQNSTTLKQIMSPVQRNCMGGQYNASLEVEKGCVPTPFPFLSIPGGAPVWCQKSTGPIFSYIGRGYPSQPCTSCNRLNSYQKIDGTCEVCGLGVTGNISVGLYLTGSFIEEMTQDAAYAIQNWNPNDAPTSLKAVSPTIVQAFYPDLQGALTGYECATFDNIKGRVPISSSNTRVYVNAPAGTFTRNSLNLFVCPNNSWTTEPGQETCQQCPLGSVQKARWPMHNTGWNEFVSKIPITAMAQCTMTELDLYRLNGTHSWGCTKTANFELPANFTLLPHVSMSGTSLPSNYSSTTTPSFLLLDYISKALLMRDGQGCVQCGPGTFASSLGVCEPCPENTFKNLSMITCRPCPRSEWTAFLTGQTSCQRCNDSICTIMGQQEHGLRGTCFPGTFISGLVNHIPICRPCPAFQYTSLSDSVRCEVCPRTQVVMGNQTACVSCTGPTVAVRGVCKECQANYVPRDNVCTPCGSGTARSENEPQCRECSANYISVSGKNCERCSNGLYSVNNTCVHCGNLTTRIGDQLTCQRCRHGYILQGVLCEPCGWQQYNPFGSNECKHCEGVPNEAIAATKCLQESDDKDKDTSIQITDNVSMLSMAVSVGAIVGVVWVLFRDRLKRPSTDDIYYESLPAS